MIKTFVEIFIGILYRSALEAQASQRLDRSTWAWLYPIDGHDAFKLLLIAMD